VGEGSGKSWQSSFPWDGAMAERRLQGAGGVPPPAPGLPTRRLPRGPHGLPRRFVADHQRRRLLAGAAQALAAHGYAEMTIEHVLTRAGVSRATFYENFDGKRECVLVAHQRAFDRLTATLLQACTRESEWPAKVAAAIGVATGFAASRPEEAQLLIVDALAPDRVLVERVMASNDLLIGLLRSGRERFPGAAAVPELTERVLIGAFTSVIGARLLAGQADRLPALQPELIQLMLMPYLGFEEARRLADPSP